MRQYPISAAIADVCDGWTPEADGADQSLLAPREETELEVRPLPQDLGFSHAPSRVRMINSAAALREIAVDWDDLWRRSDVAVPRVRAEIIGTWLDQFAPDRQFQAVTVEQHGRLVAALPLVRRRLRGLFPAATLPCNDWACAGDLLLDPEADADTALDALIGQLHNFNWRFLVLEQMPLEAPRWQAFAQACRRAGLAVQCSPQYQVGQIEIQHDWEAYEANRKGDHRRSRRRYARMLDQAGRVELKCYDSLAPGEVEAQLRRGFEVEHRSWKAAGESTVLSVPGMFEYFLREACQLAEWGQLELVFLELNGEPIAFEYGWNSKGTHFTPKVGYDEQYRKFGPGQQLRMRHLELLHSRAACDVLDFYGPLAEWSGSWTTRTYPLGRIIVAAPGAVNRRLLEMYQSWRPRLRAWRKKWLPARREAVGAGS